MTWTILVPSLGQRAPLMARLMANLMPQVDAAGGRVKVVGYWNNGEVPLIEVRQRLVESVTTDYLSFVDDDDVVARDFVPTILAVIDSNPGVEMVGFSCQCYTDSIRQGLAKVALKYRGWKEDRRVGEMYRDISHICPIRTDLVREHADFRLCTKHKAEDRLWVMQLRGKLRTDVVIDRTLYHYLWSSAISAWKDPASQIRQGDWQPPIVDSPNFSWHPQSAAATLPGVRVEPEEVPPTVFLDEPQPLPAPTANLLVIVPSRSRPQNVARLTAAWGDTGAWGVADLLIAVDTDDPALPGYMALELPEGARLTVADIWRPMVHKLNLEATREMGRYFALGFMGDDHVPLTAGWATRYLDTLRELGSGIVYCRDDYQNEKLPTQWSLTSDIVKALGGRMTPANVEHLYCDNAILDLGRRADCIRYLDDVTIQHRHYINQLAERDDQYLRVNSSEQYGKDRPAYRRWMRFDWQRDAATVRALRRGR